MPRTPRPRGRLSARLRLLLPVLLLLVVPATSADAHSGHGKARTVKVAGKLTEVHGDDLGARRARDKHFELTTRSGRYRLASLGRSARRSAGTVLVRGVRRGRTIKVKSMRPVKQRKRRSGSRKRRRRASAAAYAPGGRKVAVVLVQFQGSSSVAPSADSVRQRVFLNSNSPNAFFKEESGGATYLTGKVRSDGDVYGPYTIPATSGCDTGTWDSQARAAAEAQGHDMTGYDHIVTVWPAVSACPWAGQAGTGSWWVDMNTTGTQMESAMAHELGHNMGVHHAAAYSCSEGGKRVTLSSSCTTDEYGDPFDTMGCCGFLGHNSALRKAKWGWYGAGSAVTATGTGSFLLSPMEQPSTGVTQSLRIPRPSGDFYYLEFRRPYGFDAFPATSPVVNGVTVRLAGDVTTNMKSYLLDMTPGTTSFADAPLASGRSWLAADVNKTIVVDSISSSGAVVRIVDGPYTAPDTTAPSVTVSPSDGAKVKGTKATLKGTATDSSGVSKIELMVDGSVVASAAGGSVSYSWVLRSVPSGTHVVTARAYDTRGNVGSTSSTITK